MTIPPSRMAAHPLALGLALLLVGCGLPPGTANDPSGGSSSGGSSSGGSVSEGARLYAAKCARCHGELTVSVFRNATAAQIVARHRNLVTDVEAAAIADALSNRHAWSDGGTAEGVSSGGGEWDASDR